MVRTTVAFWSGLLLLVFLFPQTSSKIEPFPLSKVLLLEGTDHKIGFDLNLKYMLDVLQPNRYVKRKTTTMITSPTPSSSRHHPPHTNFSTPPPRLLWCFRQTAGLPTPDQPYDGWEAPTVEVRGQFIGHYLSALALSANALSHSNTTRSLQLRSISTYMVSELSKVQATYGDGYLSAFPKEHFDRLEAFQPVWAPYYVIHKIMAGLIDQHTLVGTPQALDIVVKMASYFCGRIATVIREKGYEHWVQALDVEFGGMQESLHILSTVIMEQKQRGDRVSLGDKFGQCALFFSKPNFYEPLVHGGTRNFTNNADNDDDNDPLPGRHANTHLAQVNGFAARHTTTGDPSAKAAVSYFYSTILSHHSFSTGGSNWGEYWHDEDSLGSAVNDTSSEYGDTEESCTQYNILKIARYLFQWTGGAVMADFYERALLNGIIGIQRRPHTHTHTHENENENENDGDGSHSTLHHNHNHRRELTNVEPTIHNQGAQLTIINPPPRGPIKPLIRPTNYKVVSWPYSNDDDLPPQNTTSIGMDDLPLPGPGQYIYMQPLGRPPVGKPTAAHGWGNALESFWCCYGTAVESFSKIGDSIYFKEVNNENDCQASASSSSSSSSSLAAAAAVAAVPKLYINQLVSSRLRWDGNIGCSSSDDSDRSPTFVSSPNVEINMETDMYSDNVARAVVNIKSIDHDHNNDAQESMAFDLQWRIPGWTERDAIVIKKNGVMVEGSGVVGICGQTNNSSTTTDDDHHQQHHQQHDTTTIHNSQQRQQQQQYAVWCSLGRIWNDGDILEITMPMKITSEPLNEKHISSPLNLKAVMMGPFLMAGLTVDDDRRLDADPNQLQLTVPDTRLGLVSLYCSSLSTQEGVLVVSPSYSSQMSPQPSPPPSSSSEEGGGRKDHIDVRCMNFHQVAVTSRSLALHGTFIMHKDGVYESSIYPGKYLHVNQKKGRKRGGNEVYYYYLGEEEENIGGLKFGPGLVREYPRGTRVIKGTSKSYVVVPIGQIIDENYTAYFKFDTKH